MATDPKALDALAEMRKMAAAICPGPFEWGGSDDDPAKYAAECAQKSVDHGDAVPQTWTVWSNADPDDPTTTAITGNGPHSEATAALLAHLLTNFGWLLDLAEKGASLPAEQPATPETKWRTCPECGHSVLPRNVNGHVCCPSCKTRFGAATPETEAGS